MGGIPLLLCGDFRQILPVVPSGTRGNIIDSTLKRSTLWPHVETHYLKQNMRALLSEDTDAHDFSQLLLSVGNDSYTKTGTPFQDSFSLKNKFNVVNSLKHFIDNVYPDFLENFTDMAWLSERAILCTVNDDVKKINQRFIDQLPTEGTKYRSINRLFQLKKLHFIHKNFLIVLRFLAFHNIFST